jgi:hypothetical protein
MKRTAACLLLAATLFAVSGAIAKPRNVTDPDAPRTLPDEGPVAVQWTDPASFTELKFSGNRWESQRGNWVYDLALHLRKEAEKRLPAGERLEVTITDIDRAGSYEPGRGVHLDNVRILREIYPPTIELGFKRYGADGQLLADGERTLRDLMYLSHNVSAARNHDSLVHEKRLIDEWLRDELGARQVASR